MLATGCVGAEVGVDGAVGVMVVPPVVCPGGGEVECWRRNQLIPPTASTPAAAAPATITARREIPCWAGLGWLCMGGELISSVGESGRVTIVGIAPSSPGDKA